jgi:histidine triad (HIT) family protein
MDDCIFCKIIAGEIPSSTVYEDELLKAFRDISPKAPVHVLIVPKQHFTPAEVTDGAKAGIVGQIFVAANKIAEKEGVAKSGFRLIANSGPDSGQEVDHLHFHLLAGRPLGPMLCEHM